MRYLFAIFLSVLFAIPAFAQGKGPLTVSRHVINIMAQKGSAYFAKHYVLPNRYFRVAIWQEFVDYKKSISLCQLPVEGQSAANTMISSLSNKIFRTAARQIELLSRSCDSPGYMTSFARVSQEAPRRTGLEYSDMALILRYALQDPTGRNFSGYFVKDIRDLQKVAIHPATGQTLDEALRTAYQQAAQTERGLLIITEELPEQCRRKPVQNFKVGPVTYTEERGPAQLKDMYVLDWINGEWISYKKSFDLVSEPKEAIVHITEENFIIEEQVPRRRGVVIEEQGMQRRGNVRVVKRASELGQQIEYARKKGYPVYLKLRDQTYGDPLKTQPDFVILFAKEQGMPRYDDVYELERPLMGLE